MKRGWLAFGEEQLLLCVLFALLVFLVIMAAEWLHQASGGAIPQLIEWGPEQKRPAEPARLIRYVGEEEE